MRTKILCALTLCYLVLGTGASAQPTPLVAEKSAHDLSTTVARLEGAIKQRGATIVAKVDHAAAAKASGLELRPTVVLIFGNPKLGTPLMQSDQSVGLDLPLRILVWQDTAGAVMVGYRPPTSLAQAYSIQGQDAALATMTNAMRSITEESVRP